MPRDDDGLLGSALNEALAAISRRPALYDVAAAVNQMVRSAVDLVPGAAAGGVSISAPGTGGAHGSTSEAAADLDALQHSQGQGPCLSALHGPPPENTVVVARDLAGHDASRWPRFAPAAVKLGFPAVMSLQLPAAAAGVGAALNLYSRAVDGFKAADLVLADMFVKHLAGLLFGKTGPARSTRRTEVTPTQEQQLLRRLGRPVQEP